MKCFFILLSIVTLVSCNTARYAGAGQLPQNDQQTDPLITQSLFDDKTSSISEENIQRILAGDYALPTKLRVAVVNLETPQQYRYNWNDEAYIKNQQVYVQTITDQLLKSARVNNITVMPGLMISKPFSITNLREAGVRMQADILIIYSTVADIYYKYKMFSKDDIKAFATTQVVLLDTRTALVPFTFVSTKDVLAQKISSDGRHAGGAKKNSK